MIKDWINKRKSTIIRIMAELGLDSYDQNDLAYSTLVIYVTYGARHNNGACVQAKPRYIALRENSMTFEFEANPIEVVLDCDPKKKLGGDLRNFSSGNSIFIESLTFRRGRWFGTFSFKDVSYDMATNLDVEIVPPKY